ncbi:hypothetical protein [Sphingomonas sp. TREG-RG-20F-R18-01]|uniref:hypothetical protein n=1 Tax=Sphingomonas sp. TREG-RG-20F-R18-01 TaxID=2914982 RepID=UPI001F55E5B1|nr:hypothetical protein [Sphingomonas sp. TREG-RG-20F-R18-01]
MLISVAHDPPRVATMVSLPELESFASGAKGPTTGRKSDVGKRGLNSAHADDANGQ